MSQYVFAFSASSKLNKKMKNLLKTVHLEFEKSTFLMDLVEENQHKYVRVSQTILDEENGLKRELKINPSVLRSLILGLESLESELPEGGNQPKPPKKKPVKSLNPNQQSEIVRRYLKNVKAEDIAMQFDCSQELVEQILRNHNVVVISNNDHDPPKRRRRRGRK